MTALIFLAACSGNAPAGVFRPASAPIYSSAVLDISRLAGRWQQVADFPVKYRDEDMGQQPWWVLWADTDYRTLVIGTPSGAFGFVLNRGGLLPEDRLRSAREVLAWNRYDLALLR